MWEENGQLRYRAPRGALTGDDIESLRTFSDRIVALLQQSAGRRSSMPSLKRRAPEARIPLGCAQQRYWRSIAGSQRSVRSVAFAVRLSGVLDTAGLERSLAEAIRRHEALRTRIVCIDGVPEQVVDEPLFPRLDCKDLSHLPERTRAAELERLLTEFVLDRVDVAFGPVFLVRLLKLGSHEHVLAMSMEHIVSDGFSRAVLLRDLLEIYRSADRAYSLPEMRIQMGDYAVWQHRAYAAWNAQHGDYWKRHLEGCKRLRRADLKQIDVRPLGWRALRFSIGPDTKKAMIEWSRTRRTTMVLMAFTAFSALVMRWYEVMDVVICYQTDGRTDPLVENSIGYFASELHLRMRWSAASSFLDLLDQATREYCSASEHADHSYLAAQWPPLPYTRNPGFNWVPNTLGAAHGTQDGGIRGLAVSSIPLPDVFPEVDEAYDLDYEPGILLHEREDAIDGMVLYPSTTASNDSMMKFRDGFLFLLEELMRQPERRLGDVLRGEI